VCKDPVGITEVEETFQGFREEKLRRKSAFVHKSEHLQRSAEVEESFEDSKRTKLRRESAFMHRVLQVSQRSEGDPLEGLSSRKLRRESVFKNTDRSCEYRLRSRDKG
jgi:hypothetical protein